MEKDSFQNNEVQVSRAEALAPQLAFMAITERRSLDDEPDLGWQAKALCAQVDPDAFFPEKGGSVKAAKKACGRCEVTQECLDFALENDIRDGVWGGKTVNERRALIRRRAA